MVASESDIKFCASTLSLWLFAHEAVFLVFPVCLCTAAPQDVVLDIIITQSSFQVLKSTVVFFFFSVFPITKMDRQVFFFKFYFVK